jgi:hypothetical protein
MKEITGVEAGIPMIRKVFKALKVRCPDELEEKAEEDVAAGVAAGQPVHEPVEPEEGEPVEQAEQPEEVEPVEQAEQPEEVEPVEQANEQSAEKPVEGTVIEERVEMKEEPPKKKRKRARFNLNTAVRGIQPGSPIDDTICQLCFESTVECTTKLVGCEDKFCDRWFHEECLNGPHKALFKHSKGKLICYACAHCGRCGESTGRVAVEWKSAGILSGRWVHMTCLD